MAVLKTVLNIALDTVASPSVMLRLKDFVLLVCSALGEQALLCLKLTGLKQAIILPDLPDICTSVFFSASKFR